MLEPAPNEYTSTIVVCLGHVMLNWCLKYPCLKCFEECKEKKKKKEKQENKQNKTNKTPTKHVINE